MPSNRRNESLPSINHLITGRPSKSSRLNFSCHLRRLRAGFGVFKTTMQAYSLAAHGWDFGDNRRARFLCVLNSNQSPIFEDHYVDSAPFTAHTFRSCQSGSPVLWPADCCCPTCCKQRAADFQANSQHREDRRIHPASRRWEPLFDAWRPGSQFRYCQCR